MSEEIAAIDEYLTDLRRQGRSSPAGIAWHDFWKFLCSRCPQGGSEPLKPFILAASGESDSSKMARFRDQLLWASENGCLTEAFERLSAIPDDLWNVGSPERWHAESY